MPEKKIDIDALVDKVEAGDSASDVIANEITIRKKKKKKVDPKRSRAMKKASKNPALRKKRAKAMAKYRKSSKGKAMAKALGKFRSKNAGDIDPQGYQKMVEGLVDVLEFGLLNAQVLDASNRGLDCYDENSLLEVRDLLTDANTLLDGLAGEEINIDETLEFITTLNTEFDEFEEAETDDNDDD